MSITSEKLEIIIVTYNRAKYLANTLQQLFSENSPVKDCSITVIDNNSQDNTPKVCEKYLSARPSLTYIRNQFNIGWADIAQAFLLARKEYVWVLADDDDFDWTHWHEIEQAIQNQTAIICVCHYILDSQKKKMDPRWVLIQLSLLPAGIYNRSFFNDSVMTNMFANIYTLFPHLTFAVNTLNKGLKISVCSEILKMGCHTEETDYSYTRGQNTAILYPKLSSMSWICGFSNICSGLKDRTLAREVIELAGCQNWVYGSKKNLQKQVIQQYYDNKLCWSNLVDICVSVGPFLGICILLGALRKYISHRLFQKRG